MKRCPECRRDYYDETLLYCLDDGAHLLDGPSSAGSEEASTAILHETSPPNEAATRLHIHTTDAAAESSFRKVPKRSAKALIAIPAAVIVFASVFFAYKYFGSAGSGHIRSVAVLPFANAGGDPEHEYLSDGISEAVINSLSQLKDLKVIARSSAFQYKGKEIDLDDVARALGVQAVVTGRVVKRGDQLQISAELVKVSDKSQLWGETFSKRASDVTTIESEISKRIAERLKQKLTSGEQQQLARGASVNPEAHDLYLRGLFFKYKSGNKKETLQKSIEHFERAIAIEPNYALAYAGLADSYWYLVGNSFLDPKIGKPKAEAAVNRALELDEGLAEAHVAMGQMLMTDLELSRAEHEAKRAIELSPNLPVGRHLYGTVLSTIGRHDDAIVEFKKAKDLDPVNINRSIALGNALHFARRSDEAIDALRKVLEVDSESSNAHAMLGYAYAAKGNYELAIAQYRESMRIDGVNTSDQCYLGFALARSGRVNDALKVLTELETTKEYASPVEMAVLYTGLNEKEKAFAALERGFAARDGQLRYLGVDLSFDDLRSDPRFADLLRRVGLPQKP